MKNLLPNQCYRIRYPNASTVDFRAQQELYHSYNSLKDPNEQPSAYLIKKLALKNERLKISDIDLLIFDSLFNVILFVDIIKRIQVFSIIVNITPLIIGRI